MSRIASQNIYTKTALYSVVFDGIAVKTVIALLGMFFLFNPVASAFAAETEVQESAAEIILDDGFDEKEQEEVVEKEVVESEPELAEEVVAEESVQAEVSVNEDVIAVEDGSEGSGSESSEESIEDVVDGVPEVEVLENIATSTEEVTVQDADVDVEDEPTATSTAVAVTVDDAASTTPEAATSTDQTSNTNGSGSGAEGNNASSDDAQEEDQTVPEDEDDRIDVTTNNDSNHEGGQEEDVDPVDTDLDSLTEMGTTTATTTVVVDPEDEDAPHAISYVNNALNRYQFAEDECRTMGDGSYYCSDTSTLTDIPEDAVYAAPDTDGDFEIFVRIDGVDTQITHNVVDDSAPFYDVISNTIVWQSLIHDRYQIVTYDLDEAVTVVLTNTSYNNMQPVALDDVLFWQAWIGDNWEIVRFQDGELIQMTDNDVHDIAPYALDTYVMWQTQVGDDWDITLYDMQEEKSQSINSNTPGSAKNPRMVLMYESFDANGDVHMFGYDLRTQEHISLATVPTSLPRELPEPDGNTEKKALINVKPTLREDSEVEDLTPEPDSELPKSANPDITDVIIGVVSADIIADEDVAKNASSSFSHIEDLVIPRYSSTTTEELG